MPLRHFRSREASLWQSAADKVASKNNAGNALDIGSGGARSTHSSTLFGRVGAPARNPEGVRRVPRQSTAPSGRAMMIRSPDHQASSLAVNGECGCRIAREDGGATDHAASETPPGSSVGTARNRRGTT